MRDDSTKPAQSLEEKWKLLDLLLGKRRREPTPWPGTGEKEPVTDEKAMRKRMYDSINSRLNQLVVGEYAFFLNYGYIPNGNPSHAEVALPEGYYDRNSHRLVLEVIGDCPIDGRDILDVGCGRGGVWVVLQAHFDPHSYLGVDLSREAVSFCRSSHEGSHVAFVEGDAEHLPVPDGAFDVVINIESSNCYPNINSFYAEAHRVLREGGWFLYADILRAEEFEANVPLIRRMGFELAREVDITTNVLLACEETAVRRLKVYTNHEERAYMANFLAAPGSDLFRAMQEGSVQYRIFKILKPATCPHRVKPRAVT